MYYVRLKGITRRVLCGCVYSCVVSLVGRGKKLQWLMMTFDRWCELGEEGGGGRAGGEWDTQSWLHLDRSGMHEDSESERQRERKSEKGRGKLEAE